MIYSYSNIDWWYTATISYIIIQSPYWYTTIGYKGFYFPIDFGIVHHVKSVFNQPQWGMTEDLEHCSFGDVSKPAFCFLFFSFFRAWLLLFWTSSILWCSKKRLQLYQDADACETSHPYLHFHGDSMFRCDCNVSMALWYGQFPTRLKGCNGWELWWLKPPNQFFFQVALENMLKHVKTC